MESLSQVGTNERPIFVVGASRSGTALLQSILNNSSVRLAGETHYFDDLRTTYNSPNSAFISAAELQRCEDYFLRLSHRPYGHGGAPDRGWLPRSELRDLAARLGPGPDAYFEAYCRLAARHAGGERWGEKTPRHVFRLGEILQRFPHGQAVCMVRDARAVIASYRDWSNRGGFDFEADPGHRLALRREEARARRSYHILIASILWCGAVRAAERARRQFGPERVYIQRYEDLVREPERETERLVAWLGLQYTPSLLNVPLHNSSVFDFDARRGVTQVALDAWRTRLDAAEIGVIDWHCGRHLRRLGYPLAGGRRHLAALLAAWSTLPVAVARAALVNRDRIHNLPGYLLRRLFPSFHARPLR